MIRRLFPLAVLVACSPSPKADQAPPAEAAALAHTTLDGATASAGVAVAFVCDDSTQVYALFRTDAAGKPEVALAINDDRLYLPQLVSASGARYGDSSTTFWNKGDDAEFTRGAKQTSCHVLK